MWKVGKTGAHYNHVLCADSNREYQCEPCVDKSDPLNNKKRRYEAALKEESEQYQHRHRFFKHEVSAGKGECTAYSHYHLDAGANQNYKYGINVTC